MSSLNKILKVFKNFKVYKIGILIFVICKIERGNSWIPAYEYEGNGDEMEMWDAPQSQLAKSIEGNYSEFSEVFNNTNESDVDLGDKLLITELMDDERGKSDQVEYVWREYARVTNLTDTLSYSGFFTVNRQFNSNLFFWFFPAPFDDKKAPIILWLNGGPGTSSLFGLFVENGPFQINNQGFLEHRQNSWTLTHSMLYIDSPVGTGFSYTNNAKGYSKTQEDVADNLYEALSQFYRVFPEYIDRDLFIAGESYGGKYVPSLGYKIHLENKKKVKGKINLKGLIMGSGLSDPLTQNAYGDFLFHLGMIDEEQKAYFTQQESRIHQLIEDEEWAEATQTVQSLILGHHSQSTFFHNATGFKFYMNFRETNTPQEYKNYVTFLNQDFVRRSIHVGDQPFTRGTGIVLEHMIEDICKSVKSKVEYLLAEDFSILIYASQLDLIVPHTGVTSFIESLKWSGARAYDKAPRRIWKVNDEVAGYTKFARNLAHVFLRNAGHVAPYDQPLWTYEMISRFTKGKPF